MKKKIFYVLMIACIGMTSIVNTSCSNQTDLVANEQQEKAGTEGALVSFNLLSEEYVPTTEVETRGISNAQSGRVIASSVDEMGDGLEALTEVIEEVAPKTRTTKVAPNGNYTILAYQENTTTGQWERQAEWKGVFDGLTFKVNGKAPEPKTLKPGNCKFYAFNDSIKFENGKISAKTNLVYNSNCALYAEVTQNIPNNTSHVQVNFTLKPLFAKVNFKIKGFSNSAFEGEIKGNLGSNDFTGTYTSNLVTGGNWSTTTGNAQEQIFTGNKSTAVETSYVETTKALFVFPDKETKDLTFTLKNGISGTVYKKSVAGKTLSFAGNVNKRLEGGKSYTVVRTIYYKADYLFPNQWGGFDVGSLMNNKGRTPVGLVTDKDKKIAIALKDLDGTAQWVSDSKFRATNIHAYTAAELATMITKYEGSQESYNNNLTLDDKNKPTKRGYSYKFEAFNNISLLSNVDMLGRYMPGAGEWNVTLKYFGIANPITGFNTTSPQHNSWSGDLGYKLQEILFYQAGGKTLNGQYWGAQQWSDNKAVTVTIDSNGAHFGGLETGKRAKVRPFFEY